MPHQRTVRRAAGLAGPERFVAAALCLGCALLLLGSARAARPLTLPSTVEVVMGRPLGLAEVSYCDDAQLTLSKKAEKVVKLAGGVLEPVKAGKATLTAQRGKEKVSAAVRVYAVADAAKEALAVVNAARKAAGVKALKLSDGLNKVALMRAKELEEKYSHDRPDGRDFASAFTEHDQNYGYKGENIAAGQLGPQQVMRDWMDSKAHRANIVYPAFTRMGVAFHVTAAGRVCWAQVFGG